jgi:MerR family mercuric resistance operon transcriptional regulator
MEKLTIGNLAKQADVNVQTVRYYERRRLLPQPKRTPAGYRIYPEDAVRRLHFIRTAQELGFSLKEIQELLGLRIRPGITSADIRKRAEAKVVDIDQKIDALRAMKNSLTQIINACSGCGPVRQCPILDTLDHRRKI